MVFAKTIAVAEKSIDHCQAVVSAEKKPDGPT